MRYESLALLVAVGCSTPAATPPAPAPVSPAPAPPPPTVKTEPTCAELFAQARAYSERLGHPMAVSPEDEKEAAELCTKDAQLREIMLAALRCQEFVERSKPAIARIQGRPPTNDQQLELMRRCTLKGLGELSTCVTAATTPPAIDQCWSDMTPDRLASMSTQRPPEAAIVLRQIATAAETALARDGRFPAVEAPPTPAKSCCEGARSRCATAGAEWSTPAWRTLGVPTENTGFFQYSYKSDGKTVLATAIGDLDCDGVSITWRLEGKVEAGKAVWSMTPPPKNTD